MSAIIQSQPPLEKLSRKNDCLAHPEIRVSGFYFWSFRGILKNQTKAESRDSTTSLTVWAAENPQFRSSSG